MRLNIHYIYSGQSFVNAHRHLYFKLFCYSAHRSLCVCKKNQKTNIKKKLYKKFQSNRVLDLRMLHNNFDACEVFFDSILLNSLLWRIEGEDVYSVTLFFFFIFTLYPVYSRVGRGNLVLRHSVFHFQLNFRGE